MGTATADWSGHVPGTSGTWHGHLVGAPAGQDGTRISWSGAVLPGPGSPPLIPLITPADLSVYMRQEFPPGEQADAAAAACLEGQSLVLTYLRRRDLTGVPAYAHPAVRNVMLRRAAAIFRAPTPERNSFGAGQVSVSYDPRILTGDEERILRQYRRLRATTGESGSTPGASRVPFMGGGLLVGPGAAAVGPPWPETFGWWECGPPLDLPAAVTDPPFGLWGPP